mgnify:CR=1 FL=1
MSPQFSRRPARRRIAGIAAAAGLAITAATLVVYADRGWTRLEEVARIPLIDYILVGLIGGIILIFVRRRA